MCFIEFNSKEEKESAYERKEGIELEGRSVYIDVLTGGGGRGGGGRGRDSFGRGGRGRGRDSFGRGGRGGRGPCKHLCCCICKRDIEQNIMNDIYIFII